MKVDSAIMAGWPSWQEQALGITAGQDQLLGILSEPADTVQPLDTGVLIINGGAQYRAGSHRQFVLLARDLARAGHAVLRFDFSGMGDSTGTVMDFESVQAQIAAALDHFQACRPQIRRFVLWGLCDGASASLLYLHQTRDARVAGLCLLNPWVRSESGLARAHVKHYYRQRMGEWQFWRKFIQGGVGWQSWRSLVRNLVASFRPEAASEPFLSQMAQAWQSFDGHTLLLLSERDLTAQEFLEQTRTQADWAACLASPRVQQHVLPGADHTCSTPGASLLVQQLTLQWLAATLPSALSASASASLPSPPRQ